MLEIEITDGAQGPTYTETKPADGSGYFWIENKSTLPVYRWSPAESIVCQGPKQPLKPGDGGGGSGGSSVALGHVVGARAGYVVRSPVSAE